MTSGRGEHRILRELQEGMQSRLAGVGLWHALFARAKTEESLERKLRSKGVGWLASGKKVQDALGVRVVVFFADDVDLVERIAAKEFRERRLERSVDDVGMSTFGPARRNYVFDLPQEAVTTGTMYEAPHVDRTFELQVRTMLSEGWHEVDHDLRYKCLEEWNDHSDLTRAFNGIAATVETCDWGMLQIFEELAWRHYKRGRWSAMLRAKMRLRVSDLELAPMVADRLGADPGLGRELVRADRTRVLGRLADAGASVPMTTNNLVHLLNRESAEDPELLKMEPAPLKAELDRIFDAV